MRRAQRFALAVPATRRPDRALWLDLLASRVQAEVESDFHQARRSLECSVEHLPEFWAIAAEVNVCHWGTAVAMSEGVLSLSRKIDWARPGRVAVLALPTLHELLEAI